MKTIFIGRGEVQGYLADLIRRLDPMPLIWCPITQSGRELAVLAATEVERLCKEKGQALPEIQFLPIEMNEESKPAFAEPPGDVLRGAAVLLIDGAIHSGRTMAACAAAVQNYSPSSIVSYAIVLKRRSTFIPTLWGAMTDETDRAHFLLETIPNNRLSAGGRPQPHVHLRLLMETDCGKPMIMSGVASIDRVTWGDRLWQMATTENATTTYVLERGQTIVGFLTIHIDERGKAMTVAEVVADPTEKDKGYGGILIRFADTMARQTECTTVRLNAIENKVGLYERFGYSRVPGASEIGLDDERYVPMNRPVLYHHLPASYCP